MASTYTNNSGIEKPGTGDQSGTWGDTTNTNFDIIDRVLTGVGTITLSGTTHTLTTTDGSLSDGHYRILVLSGSPSGTNTITISPNDANKLYFVHNTSGQDAVFTQGSGSNVTVPNGHSKIIYADGAGAAAAVKDFSSLVSLDTLTINGTDVTATAAELNIMDGVTASTSELNIMDGVTATTAELNIMDGVTATASELNIMDGVTATTAELNIMDGITATTAEINYTDGVTSNIQTQIDNISSYPQVITVLTSGNYSIPSDANAVLIKASGGGGGGAAQALRDNGNNSDNGDDGGNTTVTNTTLSIAITADGGKGGVRTTSATTAQSGTSTGGDVLVQGGAFGGHGHYFQRNSAQGLESVERGYNADLVVKYVTGSNVGGETLTISYGSGGTGGSTSDGLGTVTASNGQAGYVEIWVW